MVRAHQQFGGVRGLHPGRSGERMGNEAAEVLIQASQSGSLLQEPGECGIGFKHSRQFPGAGQIGLPWEEMIDEYYSGFR